MIVIPKMEIIMPATTQSNRARREALSNLPPPDGQLCENGCGRLAHHHLMRSVKTETGHVLRWYWCCADHYKRCPVSHKTSEQKKTQTSIERFGVAHHMQSPEILAKRDQTSVERYGVSHAMKLPEFVAKKQAAEIEHHGALRHSFDLRVKRLQEQHPDLSNWAQLPETVEAIRATCVTRYGGHHFQNPALFERYQRRSKYKCYPYTLPSGRIIQVQGYENEIIDELLIEGVLESDLRFGSECPGIWYEQGGKRHRYHPDIFIVSQNLVVEVKSDYTFVNAFETNMLKAAATKEVGYSVQFRIRRSRKSPTRIISV